MSRRRLWGIVAAAVTVGSTVFATVAVPAAGAAGLGVPGRQPPVHLTRGSTGAVHAVVPDGTPLAPPGLSAKQAAADPQRAARAHLQRFAPQFGASAAELRQVQVTAADTGHLVRYQQYLDGLPVLAGQLVVADDTAGRLQSLTGEVAPGPFTAAALPAGAADDSALAADRRAALSYVAAQTRVPAAALHTTDRGRWVLDPALLDPSAPDVNVEVYRLEVADGSGDLRWTVLVNRSGAVLLGYDENPQALHRAVCDEADVPTPSDAARRCDGVHNAYARVDGGPPAGIPDVDRVYASLGATAEAYRRYAGVDVTGLIGTDYGNAAEPVALRATTRVCAIDIQPECPMPNAFWNGAQMVYGRGLVSRDITAHELTHGVTQHTSQLAYVFQSGAINESLSDTFGELVQLLSGDAGAADQRLWMIGESSDYGPVREMADPTAVPPGYDAAVFGPWHGQPDTMTSPLWYGGYQDNGGVHENSGVGNKTAYLIGHGGRFDGYAVRGLGPAKTFEIYWTVQQLLTPGADYRDLGTALPIACLIDASGRPGAAGRITLSDCAQVRAAVRATQLAASPAKGAPARVSYCPGWQWVGRVVLSQGFDDLQQLRGWTFVNAGLAAADAGFPYAKSGADAAILAGVPQVLPDGSRRPATVTSPVVRVPRHAFAHLDYAVLWDGPPAVALQFSTDGGRTWVDGSRLRGSVNAGPWTSISNGWAQARLDLSALAGARVQFRVQVADGTPKAGLFILAFLDNFRVYTCR